MGRIVYGSAGGRDMVVPDKRHGSAACHPAAAGRLRGRTLCGSWAPRLDPLEDLRGASSARTLQDEPPFSVREGEFHPGRL